MKHRTPDHDWQQIGDVASRILPGWPLPDELTPETVAELRAMWWRLTRQHGLRLKAQRGIIDMSIGGR